MTRMLTLLAMSAALSGCFGLFGGRGDDDETASFDSDDIDQNCADPETITVDIKATLRYRDGNDPTQPADGAVAAFINRATDEVLVTDTADGEGEVRLQNAPVLSFERGCRDEEYENLAEYVIESEKGILFKRTFMDWELNRLDDDSEVQSGVVDLGVIFLE